MSSAMSFLKKKLAHYSLLTPVLSSIQKLPQIHQNIPYDHIAFRTFKSNQGIQLIKDIITLNNEYIFGGELKFPEKHLNAEWFYTENQELPSSRIFISEIDESKLSNKSQKIIDKYVNSPKDNLETILPSIKDYNTLLQDSEYAAWTLVYFDTINHVTFSTDNIQELNQKLKNNNYILNTVGGEVKTSNDGLLHQSSTMSSLIRCLFKEGSSDVAGTFIEFAQRDFDSKTNTRREGFEAENAIHIFESTQLNRGTSLYRERNMMKHQ